MKKMKIGGKRYSLDDPRVRFKHISLLQDFQELKKGTEVARNRLQIVKDKKLTLQTEVRFLRKRYEFLLKVRAQSQQKQHGATEAARHSTAMTKNIDTKGAAARPPVVPKFDSSQKIKFRKKNDTMPLMRIQSLSIDLNKNITRVRNPESSKIHQLDLNQIANEDDDEFQPSLESTRIKANTIVKSFSDETLADLKLSACRNIGNSSSNRGGKRKISWQDQVALKV